MFNYFRSLYLSFKRILYWVPVIWCDRDWDHYFLFKLLNHKLRSMESYYKTKSTHSNTHKIIHSIKVSRILTDKLIKEDYFKDIEHIEKNYKHEEYMIKQDLKLLCTLIERYSHYWWD